jgi:hypothetical protein
MARNPSWKKIFPQEQLTTTAVPNPSAPKSRSIEALIDWGQKNQAIDGSKIKKFDE